MRKNIGGHIDFHTMLMCKSDSFLHVFEGEILCLGAKAESFTADINGIRSVTHRYF